MNEQELAELFRKLGARDPAAWAHSQVKEGIPQLARFLFLREAWKLVVSERDRNWLSQPAYDDVNEPGGAIGPALRRLLSLGATEADLTTVVRTMQWRILSGLCQLLDDPGSLEPEVKDIAWKLFQVNEDDQPIAPLSGLHESVLETEPSGREMRPR